MGDWENRYITRSAYFWLILLTSDWGTTIKGLRTNPDFSFEYENDSPKNSPVVRQNSIRPVFSIPSSGCSQLVPVVKSTDFSNLDHRSQLRRLLCPRFRRILGER